MLVKVGFCVIIVDRLEGQKLVNKLQFISVRERNDNFQSEVNTDAIVTVRGTVSRGMPRGSSIEAGAANADVVFETGQSWFGHLQVTAGGVRC